LQPRSQGSKEMNATLYLIGNLTVAAGILVLIVIVAQDLVDAIRTRKTALNKAEIRKLAMIVFSAMGLGALYWLLQTLD
jgi:hypothetical protein